MSLADELNSAPSLDTQTLQSEMTERRKPGRPKKIDGPKMPDSEPTQIPKKRGRKPKKQGKVIPAQKISDQIYGLHQLAVTMTGNEKYGVAKEKADQLGHAVYDVCEEYDLWWIFAHIPIVELAFAAITVEGPVAWAIITDLMKGGKKRGKETLPPDPGTFLRHVG